METIYSALNDGFILENTRYETAEQLVQLQGAALRRWPVSVRVGRATFQGHIVASTYQEAHSAALAHLRFQASR